PLPASSARPLETPPLLALPSLRQWPLQARAPDRHQRAMQAFLEYLVKGLVEKPDEVTVSPVERNGMTIYELRLNPDDVGRIIGKQGVTINAIRSLLAAGSARKGLRCIVEIVEDRPAT